MNRKLIARQLILEAKRLLAAGKDESDYVYDPDHKHKPKGGHWEKTEKGWSQKKEEKKDKGKKEEKNIDPLKDMPSDREELCQKIKSINMNDDFANSLLDKVERLENRHKIGTDDYTLSNKILNGILMNEKSSSKAIRRAYDLDTFEGKPSANACHFAAQHSNTDGQTLLKVFKNGNSSVQDKMDIVRHKNFPKEAVEAFTKGSKDQKRFIVHSGKLSEDQIIELSKDNDKYVRQEIARYCPNKRALELLSKDKEQTVRGSIAKNKNTEPELLSELSLDSSTHVREMVAANGKTPVDILQKLQRDKKSQVSIQATNTLKRIQEKH